MMRRPSTISIRGSEMKIAHPSRRNASIETIGRAIFRYHCASSNHAPRADSNPGENRRIGAGPCPVFDGYGLREPRPSARQRIADLVRGGYEAHTLTKTDPVPQSDAVGVEEASAIDERPISHADAPSRKIYGGEDVGSTYFDSGEPEQRESRNSRDQRGSADGVGEERENTLLKVNLYGAQDRVQRHRHQANGHTCSAVNACRRPASRPQRVLQASHSISPGWLACPLLPRQPVPTKLDVSSATCVHVCQVGDGYDERHAATGSGRGIR